MNEDDAPTVIKIPSTVTTIPSTVTSTSTPTTTTTTVVKRESSESSLLCKTRYKFWVLSAILLLAFWSMFTGSITLKWSTGDLSQHPDNLGFQTQDDVDILVCDLVHWFHVSFFENTNNKRFSIWFVLWGWLLNMYNRKWRRRRNWCGACGTCTRIAVGVQDCLDFGNGLFKLLMRL